MATKFIQAVHRENGARTGFYDSECEALELMEFLCGLNKNSGGSMDDWEFNLVTYRGCVIGVWDWRESVVRVRLDRLYV